MKNHVHIRDYFSFKEGARVSIYHPTSYDSVEDDGIDLPTKTLTSIALERVKQFLRSYIFKKILRNILTSNNDIYHISNQINRKIFNVYLLRTLKIVHQHGIIRAIKAWLRRNGRTVQQ